MRLNRLIEGLQILSNHYDDPTGYQTAAEHDQFYAFKTDKPLSPENAVKMQELGWFQEDANAAGDYDPEAGWSAYT
jgi:hypothetical protein